MLNPEVIKCHEDLITLETNVQQRLTMHNKAIRDGKYLSLLARVFILLIDTATQEVPMKNI